MTSPNMQVAVQKYLEAGFALVPIPRRQKGPCTKGWNKPENLVTDVTQIDLVTDGNIGLAHAACKPFPTCAIDIDDYQATSAWLLSEYGINLEELLYAPGTAVCWSGTPNRLKIFFRFPYGVPALATQQIKGPDGKMMLEFRCAGKNGETMQDVLPPSLHPSGTSYQWVTDAFDESTPFVLTELPGCLLRVWLDQQHAGNKAPERNMRPAQTVGECAPCRTMETPRAIAVLRYRLQFISADCAYDTYRDVVWAILGTGWACASEIAEQWSRSAPHRFDPKCFDNVVANFKPNKNPRPTLGTVVHLARLGGCDE
jgi:putative DNA primase/helicase